MDQGHCSWDCMPLKSWNYVKIIFPMWTEGANFELLDWFIINWCFCTFQFRLSSCKWHQCAPLCLKLLPSRKHFLVTRLSWIIKNIKSNDQVIEFTWILLSQWWYLRGLFVLGHNWDWYKKKNSPLRLLGTWPWVLPVDQASNKNILFTGTIWDISRNALVA